MENKILYDHKSRAPDHIISLEKYNWQTNLEQKNTLQLGILSWVLEKTTWKLPEEYTECIIYVFFWCLFFFSGQWNSKYKMQPSGSFHGFVALVSLWAWFSKIPNPLSSQRCHMELKLLITSCGTSWVIDFRTGVKYIILSLLCRYGSAATFSPIVTASGLDWWEDYFWKKKIYNDPIEEKTVLMPFGMVFMWYPTTFTHPP